MRRPIPNKILKLDADDQEKAFNIMREKLMESLEKQERKSLEYPQEASIIANNIASQFFQTTSLFNADLKRLIIGAIEDDRQRVREWLDQQN